MCLGYKDISSHLYTTSISLYSRNISKSILSVSPHTTKVKYHFLGNHEGGVVRHCCYYLHLL